MGTKRSWDSPSVLPPLTSKVPQFRTGRAGLEPPGLSFAFILKQVAIIGFNCVALELWCCAVVVAGAKLHEYPHTLALIDD